MFLIHCGIGFSAFCCTCSSSCSYATSNAACVVLKRNFSCVVRHKPGSASNWLGVEQLWHRSSLPTCCNNFLALRIFNYVKGFLIAWFDLCTYNWVIAIAVFTLANTTPRLHCLLSFSSDWSFLLSCYLLSFLIAAVPFCGLGGYSRPSVFHSCLPNSVLATTIFYVPLFATFILLPLIYISVNFSCFHSSLNCLRLLFIVEANTDPGTDLDQQMCEI